VPATTGLDRATEVDAVLSRLGLGRLSCQDPAGFPGRNENWAGSTDRGYRVFVKRIGGPAAQARRRLRRSVEFERLAASHQVTLAPRHFGWDEPARLLVSELVEDAVSGADLADFGADLAERAGRAIGALHRLPSPDGPDRPDGAPAGGRPVLPSLELLRGLPLAMFYECSAGELKVWQLMQNDEKLAGAIGCLLERERRAPRVPAHCDLRFDQILLAGGRLYVTDWEEFRTADAARDIGSFAGECLHRAVTGWAERTAAERAAAAAVGPVSHDQIVRSCAEGIERARPTIAAFWSGYRAARPEHDRDHDLGERAAAFAGWHLLDRMLAAARRAVRLSAVQRAAAGIGRTIMCAPGESAETIGLGLR
jgi:hypothetical protein